MAWRCMLRVLGSIRWSEVLIDCLFEREGERVKGVKIGWRWEEIGIAMEHAIE